MQGKKKGVGREGGPGVMVEWEWKNLVRSPQRCEVMFPLVNHHILHVRSWDLGSQLVNMCVRDTGKMVGHWLSLW